MRLRHPPIPQPKLRRARELRRELTIAERKVWDMLRNRRMLNLKFRRQHVVAGFIVDFYCAELRLGSRSTEADTRSRCSQIMTPRVPRVWNREDSRYFESVTTRCG